MEKQKIFWVILSVTVFVVVVLVVGVFLLKKEPTAVAASPTTPSTTAGAGIYEFGRDAGAAEGDTEVLRFVIGGDGTADGIATDGTATGAADVDSAAAVGTEPPATVAAPTSTTTASAVPAAKPAATAAKPAASTAKPAAAATAKPSSSSSAKPSATVQFWIQTGSYKSQTRAEELSQALAAKGLAGRVFSFSQADATWFRVRIGPYANRQEAEKFLAIVRKIQGLEASFISQVSGSRSAN
jgi:septal ring-binding cell division protein DamX